MAAGSIKREKPFKVIIASAAGTKLSGYKKADKLLTYPHAGLFA